ncbi:hypothetical protein SFC43_10950 [Bacteroides sp. CR5/BHMF/2]|nr:hypothetical protein [Bacteroides sp. CR5/BHMF/2]
MIEDVQNDCYWVATWGKGVVQLIPSSNPQSEEVICKLQPVTLEGYEQTPHKTQILGLLKDSRQEVLWVSAMDDLYAYRIVDNALHPVDTESFLPKGKKDIDRIIEDRAGNVWVPGYSPHTFILSFDANKIKRYPTSCHVRYYRLSGDGRQNDSRRDIIGYGREEPDYPSTILLPNRFLLHRIFPKKQESIIS